MNNMTTVREMNVYYSAALYSKALEWNDESKELFIPSIKGVKGGNQHV